MIRVRDLIERRGRSLIALSGLAFLVMLVAWAHGASGRGHMDSGGPGEELLVICAAVLGLGAVALSRLPQLYNRPSARRQPRCLSPTGAVVLAGHAPLSSIRARAGPSELQVFRR